MNKRMLIDTTHAEETRVVVLDGNRLEDYDVETSAKKQLKGNIYLAKVIRVEPSLQAAFVEYGGNRHGFLAFSEIHPDYYQIPVADRERLIALQEEEARVEDAREEAREQADEQAGQQGGQQAELNGADEEADPRGADLATGEPDSDASRAMARSDDGLTDEAQSPDAHASDAHASDAQDPDAQDFDTQDLGAQDGPEMAEAAPETVGGETDADERRPSGQSARFLRQYKIQEVIRRRQILLIQVVKEERGNKGAALTTYISLAGRFCVLMPNSPRGGGVSRKITSAADRRRLKEITAELDIPRGMAMIIRTAGAQRPRPEIKRDCEYLLRLWDDIRDQTLRAMAPALIYEEADLIKRAIRDVYSREIEEIVVDGETGWKAAREFMRNLMPAHAQKVQLWRDHGEPLFSFYQVEHHLDAMLQPVVQLRSGGYLVINQTEALVAIDVNSGRSTRERGIEETALRTNLEAADEVARQLRLRDLAGLIVIDFIDMEARKHNVMVERRLKDALKNDRARIQLGSISHFGLMEMSRQRLRPSIAESSFVACPHCAGTGFVRGTDSAALHVLRAIEEEGAKQRAAEILVKVASSVALYILNHKRAWLAEIEQRHRMVVCFAADDSLIPPQLLIEKLRPQVSPIASSAGASSAGASPALAMAATPVQTAEVAAPKHLPANGVITHSAEDGFAFDEADERDEDAEIPQSGIAASGAPDGAPSGGLADTAMESSEDERRRKRRRRRRRGGRREEAGGLQVAGTVPLDAEQPDILHAEPTAEGSAAASFQPDDDADGELGLPAGEVPMSEERTGARKRGRRGGGRSRAPREPSDAPSGTAQLAQDNDVQSYRGPTPADPFGGSYDIFDVIEQDADMPPPRPAAIPAAVPAAVPAEAGPPALATPETSTAESAPEIAPDVVPEPVPAQAAAAETSSEPVSEPAKPKRKRAATSRAKPAAGDDAEPKPKPVRKSRARKPPAGPAAQAAGESPGESSGEAPAEPVAETLRELTGRPEPTLEPNPEPHPEPAAPDLAADAEQRPRTVVQPILIDTLAEPPARRTGWWKR